ncbi:MAG: TonB-dependent receptor, partial [Acidobacteria bacterium]|nr:TonB-dependent receptor [Acidobacteriota bacterium]
FLAAQQAAPFTGRVVDATTQKPVADAIITIPGVAGTSRTDGDGRFVWERSPAVPFQVIIVLPGGQVARPVDVTAIETGGITIPVHSLSDESVTVLGVAPSIVSAPGAGKTLLSPAQIASRAPENLTQALETVPGINVVSEGHAAVPAIRGLARGRTLLLIDGARVSSERRVGPSATFADPASFEGIDVSRGPGSVAYGSDAIGGVISVRTRRAHPGSPLHVRVSGTYGAGIPDRRVSGEVAKGLARGGVIVQVHAREADDWDSPVDGSTVFNSGWKDRGILTRVDHQVAGGLLTVGWQGDFGRDVERPRNNSRAVRFYYPYENSHRFTSAYELANVAGLQQLSLTAYVGTFDQRTDQDRFATSSSVRSIDRSDVSARDFHVKASGVRGQGRTRVEFGLDVNGRFGLDGSDSTIRYDAAGAIASQTAIVSVDSARRINTGAYVQADAAVARALRIAAGARGDLITTQNAGGYFGDRSTSNGAFSGFGSVTVGPFSGFAVTGQVARGFRDPTLSDRYFRGPSGRGFITGNPDLEPEASLQFDLAARYAIGRAQLAAYAYRYRIDDLVERFTTEMDFFFFRNRGRARLRGIELEARAEAGTGFSIEGGLNIGRGVALDDKAHLDDISPNTVFVMLRQDYKKVAYAQVRASYMADDTRPGPSEVVAPAARVIDLSAGWKLGRGLELRGVARNLLDDDYYASPDPRFVYAPGRSASATLGFQF